MYAIGNKKITLESEDPRVMEEKRREGTHRAPFRAILARAAFHHFAL
jgi:hypothetical protein